MSTSTSKTDLDLAFEELEKDYAYNRVIRKEMINNLRQFAAKTKIDEYDKPMAVQAKLMIFKTLDDIVKSDEDVSMKKVKFRLARKDSETNGAIGTAIINLLKQVRATGNTVDGDAAIANADNISSIDAIEARARQLVEEGDEKVKKALDISDGELLECAATPSTDNPNVKLKPLEKEAEE